jgi:short-subunit dehydrogenase
VGAVSTALVTGATAGIGNAFVRRLAKDRYDLVLVSRDEQRLGALAAELRTAYGVHVEVLAADLAEDHGCAAVEARLADRELPVDVLVNNAGFSVNHRFVTGDIEDEERMLRVLVRAVLRLTRAAVPGMIERRHGAVINVSSVAGFVPQGTYSAAKAWVTSFTQGLAADLTGTGVRVVALCPGFTNTELHERAGIDMSRTPDWLWLDADEVVDAAFAALARGTVVCVPGAQYKTIVTVARHVPTRLLTAVARRVRGRRGAARRERRDGDAIRERRDGDAIRERRDGDDRLSAGDPVG